MTDLVVGRIEPVRGPAPNWLNRHFLKAGQEIEDWPTSVRKAAELFASERLKSLILELTNGIKHVVSLDVVKSVTLSDGQILYQEKGKDSD